MNGATETETTPIPVNTPPADPVAKGPDTPPNQPTGEPKPNPDTNPTKEPTKQPEDIIKSPEAPSSPPEFKVPDAYKDKPWAAKIKSEDDLYKQIDTLNALKGKKMIVPDLSKATDAEREEYYAQLRPASVDAYDFGKEPDPEIKKVMGESLMKNGVAAVPANELIKDFGAAMEAAKVKLFSPEGHMEAMKEAFGDSYEKITGTVRMTLKGIVPEADNTLLDNLPNPYLGVIYRTLGNIIQKFGLKPESGAHIDAGAGANTPVDVNTVREGIRNEMFALQNRPHSYADIQALQSKLNKTYENDPRLKNA